MIPITDKQIQALDIAPTTCVEWVREAFIMKPKCQLPTKVHVHPQGNDFITSMPCLLPENIHKFGIKVVSRVNGRKPTLKSNIMLFDSKTGILEALMESNWITAMRTGAVATLAIKIFSRNDANNYAMIGLGSTARATMTCLLNEFAKKQLNVRLFRYKDQAERFAEEYKNYNNVSFSIVNTIEELVKDADVVISCITDASGLIVEDEKLFKPGVLVVPVHTRGFQNCDTIFDKVFADDTMHVSGFKYFNQFKQFAELNEVLLGQKPGRENDEERILIYNIGLGLHDVFWANNVCELLKNKLIYQDESAT